MPWRCFPCWPSWFHIITTGKQECSSGTQASGISPASSCSTGHRDSLAVYLWLQSFKAHSSLFSFLEKAPCGHFPIIFQISHSIFKTSACEASITDYRWIQGAGLSHARGWESLQLQKLHQFQWKQNPPIQEVNAIDVFVLEHSLPFSLWLDCPIVFLPYCTWMVLWDHINHLSQQEPGNSKLRLICLCHEAYPWARDRFPLKILSLVFLTKWTFSCIQWKEKQGINFLNKDWQSVQCYL